MSDSVSQSSATTPSRGLTSEEARRRLLESGPNAVIEKKSHLILALLGKFWAPVPWMLEATIVLELALGKFLEGIVIAVLLVSNAS
ncbi:MAG: cation-transporting P-type ATPase, partial [Candidatus Binataceae bacterium]